MGLLATAGVTAPAAMAAGEETPDETATNVPEAGTVTGEVLTPSPVPTESDEESNGAIFGLGKPVFEATTVAPDVVFAAGSSFPEGAVLDRTGAKFELTYAGGLLLEVADDASSPVPPVLTCTWDELDADGNGNPCDFTGDDAYVTADGRARLDPFSSFTLELLEAPISGQVLLPAAPDRVLDGSWVPTGTPLPMVFQAPGAYRTIGVDLTDARGKAVTGATFELCTVAGATCDPSASGTGVAAAPHPVVSATSTSAGRLLFPGLYLAGDYQIRQTASADGSAFSSAPLTLTLAAAGTPADTTAPVLLPVALPPVPVTPAPEAPSPVPAPAPVPAPVPAAPPTPDAPVPAASGTGEELASTGAEPLPVLALGTGLVLAGGAVIVATARRRTR